MKLQSYCCYIILVFVLIISILLFAAGITLYVERDVIVQDKIFKNIPIVPGSQTYNKWIVPPYPVYLSFYLFSVNNTDEIMKNKNAKIEIVQKGPFVYREHRKKFNVSWNGDESLVKFRDNKWYVFSPEMSEGNMDTDPIECLNMAVVAIGSLVDSYSKILEKLVDVILRLFKDEELFITKSAADLIWGYPIPLLSELEALLEKVGIHLPIPATIGLFSGKNFTDEGSVVIHSGTDPTDFAIISTWGNRSSLPYWGTKEANMINGTDGTMFPPFPLDGHPVDLYIYSTDLCRSIPLTYRHETTEQGIRLLKYTPPDFMFQNASVYPFNKAFCGSDGYCPPSGLLNMDRCQPDTQVYLSLPHFTLGSPDLLEPFDGLAPSKDLYSTLVEVEPWTGLPLVAHKRLQINMRVKDLSEITQLKQFGRNLFFPIAWIDEFANVDKPTADQFKSLVYSGVNLLYGLCVTFIILGIIFICLSSFLLAVRYRRIANMSEDQPLISPSK